MSWDYPIDCGPSQLSWDQQKDGGTPELIDSLVMTNDTSTQTGFQTIAVQTSDASKAGVYSISYTVSLKDHPQATTTRYSGALTVTVNDLCSADSLSITPTNLPDAPVYKYTGETITVPTNDAFTQNHADCPIVRYECEDDTGASCES